tara:strand:+ start:613 stop:1482 length:870 start_codon:yes stop_codon:yes gene_type:complete
MKITIKDLTKIIVRFIRTKSKYRISFDYYSMRTDVDNFDSQMCVSQIGYYGHHVEKALKHQKRGKRGREKATRLQNLLDTYITRNDKDPVIIDWASRILIEFAKTNHKIYVTKLVGEPIIQNDVIDFIKTRTTVRFWKNKKISKEILEDILKTALTSSISCNRQSVKFLIKENTIDKNKGIGDSNNPSMLSKAPIVVYVSADSRFYSEKYGNALDVGGVCATLLLAAKAYGLSGCWIYTAETIDQKKVGDELGLERHDYIYSRITLGYPYDDQEKPPRSFVNKINYFEG